MQSFVIHKAFWSYINWLVGFAFAVYAFCVVCEGEVEKVFSYLRNDFVSFYFSYIFFSSNWD